MSPEEELVRAGEARQMLDSRIFIEASQRVIEGLAAQRKQVPIRDTDMHTKLIMSEQLWLSIQGWLEQTAETGKFAEFSIRQREAQKKGLFGVFK